MQRGLRGKMRGHGVWFCPDLPKQVSDHTIDLGVAT